MMWRHIGAWALCVFLAVPAWSAEEAPRPRHRIAWLGTGSEGGSVEYIAAFKTGLKEQGLVEGRDYVFDPVYANNHYDRFPGLAQQLLSRNPSVIMVTTIASVRAAQQATRTVPIVMMSTNDPVAAKLVKSLAHPGGNTTGLGNMAEDISGKYIQLIRELRPQAKTAAIIMNPGNPSNMAFVSRLQAMAQPTGLAMVAVAVGDGRDLKDAFADIVMRRADTAVVIADTSFLDRRIEICTLARQHRLAVLAFAPDFTDTGCLVGIGTRRSELFRYSSTYVKKILSGARPENLPVELPVRFELAINAKTARAIGVDIPPTTLLRADRVIE